jgi:uncharacterized membrane protein YfcA
MSLNTLYSREQEFRGVVYAVGLFAPVFVLWRCLRRRNRPWLYIFALALVLRAALGLLYSCRPVSDFLTEYQSAAALAAGDVSLVLADKYTHKYPFILPFVFYQALLIRIFSDNVGVLQGINALITASICLLIYGIGSRYHRDCGILAGLCYAMYPSSVVMTQVLTNQHIAAFLFYLVFWLLLRQFPPAKTKSSAPPAPVTRGFWPQLAAAGCLFGLAHSMRGIGQPLLIAILLFWLLYLPWKRVLLQGAVFVLCFALVSGGFYLFAWQRGILDSPWTRGDLRYKILTGFNHDSQGLFNTADYEGFFGAAPGDSRDRFFREAMDERLENPVSVLYLMGAKVYRMWGVTDSSFYWMTTGEIGALQEALGANPDQPGLRRRLNALYDATNIFAVLDTGFYGLLTLSACLGAVPGLTSAGLKKFRASPVQALLAWALLGYASAHLLIEIQPRYRYFAMPAICILASMGLAKIWRRIGGSAA